MKSISELVSEKPWVGWALFGVTLLVVFLFGLFGASIVERRQEAFITQHVVPLPEWEPRNEVWGQNFPRQWERYRRTARTDFQSKYAGSTDIDYLERYPKLVVMWAGYAFSRDYSQGRGHYYSVDDIRATLRTNVPQPGTCWTCKSTDVPRLMNEMGVAEFYNTQWHELGSEVVNHIGCQDCHDPKTMNLRITRPALVEAFQRQGKNINDATHQEMRSLVCAQCHVEYYFRKDDNYLMLPWDKGMGADEMAEYKDEIGHVDWVHAISRAPMLKAQHPDYELFTTGVHAQRGVSCSDCHMPYRSEGGVKFTDHHLTSPLQNIAASCQVCHRESEETLMRDVITRQDRISNLRYLAEDAITKAHIEAGAAWEAGATEDEMREILQLIRHSQWRWDYVAASNGMGFHSPQESARVLGTAIQKAGDARLKLSRVLMRHGLSEPVQMPDLSTKAKAQEYIGFDMDALREENEEFLRTVVPQWERAAEERAAAGERPALQRTAIGEEAGNGGY